MNPAKPMGIEAQEFQAPSVQRSPSSAKILHGRLIAPKQQVLLYSPDEWEAFIEEWAYCQKTKYAKVVRLAGANDMGIDVAGLTDEAGFKGVWDNYQCKHYEDPLTPSIAIPEIGKMLWHSVNGHFTPPRKYFFMAPKDCGMSLKKLLLDKAALAALVLEKWDAWCSDKITTKTRIQLEGAFRTYVETFDYSKFSFKTALEVIEEHRHTPYYAARFGGGLPDRPGPAAPPIIPAHTESRYLQQLLDAYSDHKSTTIADHSDLQAWPPLLDHYHRQREFFYHAESLRNFARDTVPPGTFEELQDEVHAGIVDVAASTHVDALACVNSVTLAATQLALTANGLISVVKIQDRRGICHQLANTDRLKWKQ